MNKTIIITITIMIIMIMTIMKIDLTKGTMRKEKTTEDMRIIKIIMKKINKMSRIDKTEKT